MASVRNAVAAAALVVALVGWQATSEQDDLDVGQALGVARAINQGEVEQARTVQDRVDGEAKRFAEVMIREHGATIERLEKLARELGVEPRGSDLSRQLEERSRQVVTTLRDAEDAEVSRKYIDSQVDMHRQALEVIDGKLLPAARQQPRLEAAFREMREHVAAHLRHAEQLRGS